MERFRNILVAVDSEFEKQPALESAIRLAEQNQAKLKVVDVVPDYSWAVRLAMSDHKRAHQALAEEKSRYIESIAKPLRDRGIDVSTKVLFGKASREIIREVLRSQHDLVVRVTKGANSRRTGFFGTTSMRLLRRCPSAVWLVQTDAQPRLARVLAAVDPNPNDDTHAEMNRTIMELGMSIAENAEFHVVHAWNLFGLRHATSRDNLGEFEATKRKVEAEVAREFDRFLSDYGLNHQADHVHLRCDEIGPEHAILELAKQQEIDLIVMGTVGRAGVAGALMGNTAERVLDQLECSVLAIKPDGFVSPVALPEQ